MNYIDKIILKIFSVIIIVISIITLLFTFDIISDLDFLKVFQDGNTKYVVIIICIIFILAGVKSLFVTGRKEDISDGVLLENSNGKLFITKESIISMIEVDLKKYDEISSSNVKIGFDDEKNLFAEIVLVLDKDTNIKEISSKLQNSIKTAVKKSADLDVKSIDIKIKNVQEEKIKE